jgi:hypothetical protein
MKRVLTASLAVAMMASLASATDLNVSVKATSNDTNTISVAPGDLVEFYITGDLSDDLNEGLALVGYNLHFTGGALAADTVAIPAGAADCLNPMPNFVKPDGITNPDGFGGTLIGDDLIQIGGAQNTIKNTVANAAFPIGTVVTGIAQPAGCGTAILATGSLTAPATVGTYELQLSELFANVITDGEIGDVFWATEAAGVGTIGNLTIEVGGDVPSSLTGTTPACDTSLARSQGTVVRMTFDGTVTLPTAGDIEIRELADGGTFVGGDLSASFTFSLESGDTVLRIAETGSVLTNEKWYGITNPAWAGTQAFKITFPVVRGDADSSGVTTFADLSFINANLVSPAVDDDMNDVDASGAVTFADISLANTFIGSTRPTKPTGHDCP